MAGQTQCSIEYQTKYPTILPDETETPQNCNKVIVLRDVPQSASKGENVNITVYGNSIGELNMIDMFVNGDNYAQPSGTATESNAEENEAQDVTIQFSNSMRVSIDDIIDEILFINAVTPIINQTKTDWNEAHIALGETKEYFATAGQDLRNTLKKEGTSCVENTSIFNDKLTGSVVMRYTRTPAKKTFHWNAPSENMVAVLAFYKADEFLDSFTVVVGSLEDDRKKAFDLRIATSTSGAPVYNANVTVKDSDGVASNYITDAEGKIPVDLPPGDYTISTESEDYEDITDVPFTV